MPSVFRWQQEGGDAKVGLGDDPQAVHGFPRTGFKCSQCGDNLVKIEQGRAWNDDQSHGWSIVSWSLFHA